MNSSFAPLGPRVRNSLITTGGAGVGDTDGDGLGDGDGDGDGEGLGPGDGDGLGAGAVIVRVAGTDSTLRPEAKICTVPGPTPLVNPD